MLLIQAHKSSRFGVQPIVEPGEKSAPMFRFGINLVYHGLEKYLREYGGTSKEYISGQNDKLESIGINWVRSGGKGDLTSFTWKDLEPEEGVFDFTLSDIRIKEAQSRSLNLLGNVEFQADAVPDYASLSNKYFDDAKYLEYLNKMVERYDGDGLDDMPELTKPIKYWEIGNEVVQEWMFDGTAEEYAHVLKISYESIKSNCSDCQVLIGGWVSGKHSENQFQKSLAYLERVLLQDGGKHFDIMNFHSYADPCDFEEFLDCDFKLYYHARGFRDLLSEYGFSKPTWITESNTKLYTKLYKERQSGRVIENTLEQQSQDLVKRMVIAFDAGVEVFFWHGLDDAPGSPGVGFFDEKGKPKPIYYNLKLLIEKIGDFTSVKRIDLGNDNLYFYQFETVNDPVSILWTEIQDTSLDLSNYFGQNDLELIYAITESGQSDFEIKTVDKNQVPINKTPVFITGF